MARRPAAPARAQRAASSFTLAMGELHAVKDSLVLPNHPWREKPPHHASFLGALAVIRNQASISCQACREKGHSKRRSWMVSGASLLGDAAGLGTLGGRQSNSDPCSPTRQKTSLWGAHTTSRAPSKCCRIRLMFINLRKSFCVSLPASH